jgi:hypothetical protein
MLRLRRFISETANRMKFGGVRHALSVESQILPSLFIVSLPRSFSSYSYLLTRSALRLREPEFTTFGEILNFNRYHKGRGSSGGVPPGFFTCPQREPAAFRQASAFLDRVVEARGFAYKDVVQPFAVAEWLLRARGEFRILRIRRNLADVAMAMFELKWLYPAAGANASPEAESAALAGLVLADNTLARLPAVTVEYDDLVRDGTALSAALARLYPKHEFPAIRFHNHRRAVERAKTMSRRKSPQYRVIERRIADLRKNLCSVKTCAPRENHSMPAGCAISRPRGEDRMKSSITMW